MKRFAEFFIPYLIILAIISGLILLAQKLGASDGVIMAFFAGMTAYRLARDYAGHGWPT